MAERKHSQQRKAGGPLGAARDASGFSSFTPFLWRRPSPANDNPAPLAKRLRRTFNLLLLGSVVGGLVWSAIVFR
ncbi:hypothetical protein [Niveispirillum sp. KHB5.9]|uniref:hypothetical protein n=1 Tax=Niveispirillum sp. KHB5.9 TaxID=3400269 RepID=UPI003A86247A